MTICIAAIGKHQEKDCEAIVLATDHMITLPQIGQFEHEIEKYRQINSNTIAMLSGEALLFDKILKGIKEEDTIDKIEETIHKNMIRIRDERIQKVVFEKLKIDYKFLKELPKSPQLNSDVHGIIEFIRQFTLNTSVLLVAFKGGEARIIEIN